MSILARASDASNILKALSASQAIIEFDLDGKILDANENFCKAMGYARSELIGKHHSMFLPEAYARSADYKSFWSKLCGGTFDRQQYKRIGKGGREVWIEASYNPVKRGGRPYKIVKIATDITAVKLQSVENAGKMSALTRAQAVIEFSPDGKILTANQNFLSLMGYTLSELSGQSHSLFCARDYVASPDYRAFWDKLRAGEFVSSEFLRIAKGGKPVHIQAAYNPIFDDEGRLIKVVKFATDVTGRVNAVDAIAHGLERLADGDVSLTIETPFVAAFERLRENFNASVGQFRATLERVQDTTGTLAHNSGELKSGAAALADRTEKQASALEQASAALEEITVTVKQSAERSREMLNLVKDAREATSASVAVVSDAVQAIGRIEHASSEISNIIDVIDQIAFQTNLLALNAGVEAARAGEAGKGFAVVAQEVRALAQRSAEAARDIAALITNSTREVEDGVRLVSKTGEGLEKIDAFVLSISKNVDSIATGAAEQSTSLSEINSAVSHLDQMTQQNGALVAQISHASTTVDGGAAMLSDLVGGFNLGQGGRASAPSRRQAA